MYPRRTSRMPRRSSVSRRPMRRLWLIAGATCVPLLIVAYALTVVGGESATDAAYVAGTIAQGAYGQTAGAGGWGRGGHTTITLTLTDSTQGWTKTEQQNHWYWRCWRRATVTGASIGDRCGEGVRRAAW